MKYWRMIALNSSIFEVDNRSISTWDAVKCISHDLTNDMSTLVLVLPWCCQAPSHYRNQCWSWSIKPHGFSRPQWVKITRWSRPCMYKVYHITFNLHTNSRPQRSDTWCNDGSVTSPSLHVMCSIEVHHVNEKAAAETATTAPCHVV